jgi:hypothetical protein
MNQYVSVSLTLKQAEAALDAIRAAHERAEHLDLQKPHGTVKERTAMFYLQAALVSAIREGQENLSRRGPA